MEIPEKLAIVEGFYFTDGGSIVLIGEDTDSTRHQITLVQHRFLDTFDPNMTPGRLYFNQQMIPVRSEEEADLISLLEASEIVPDEPPEPEKSEACAGDGLVVVVGDDLKEYYAKVAEGKGEAIQHLIGELLNFVQSREYFRIANKIGTKHDGE